jgi:hypothetical protein
MTDMSEVPEKCYKHLTDEDLAILLGGYRVINYKDTPDRLKGVDVPTGLELVYEIQRRLKLSGPNISWDQAVDRRAPVVEEEPYGLPQSFSLAGLLTDEGRLLKQFKLILHGLTLYKTYPDSWPDSIQVFEQFKQFLTDQREGAIRVNKPTVDLVVVIPKEDNAVLQEINRLNSESGLPRAFCFVAYRYNLEEVMY